MVVELAGSRLVAPYFGTSLFAWSSLIGVILGALSLGYYLGGMLADRDPRMETLAAIILASGVLVAATPIIEPFAAAIGMALGLKYGVLLMATALFALPAVLLGMVSPYAVKIGADSLGMVGSTTGRLYAVSTLGSIVGTLAAGFILIPSFGIRAILFGTSAVLVALSLPFIARRAFAGLICVLLLAFLSSVIWAPGPEIAYEGDSEYYHIRIVDDAATASRVMVLDAQLSGGVRLDSTGYLFGYYETSSLSYLLVPSPGAVLFMGAGPCAEPIAMRRHLPSTAMDIVEIDPKVVELAQSYFGLQLDGRTHAYVADGRTFLASGEGSAQKYGIIFMDVYKSESAVPYHLATLEAVRLEKARLAPGGVVVVNVLSAPEGRRSPMFRSVYKTYLQAFGTLYVFPVEPENPLQRQNIIIIATDSPRLSKQEFIALAEHSGDTGLVARAEAYWENEIPLDDVPVLTDDYAPVESLNAAVLDD